MKCERCDEEMSSGVLRLHVALDTCVPLPSLSPLAVILEAELILMESWARQHGCGCPQHLPWKITA